MLLHLIPFLAVTKQLYESLILSLCPPVTPFSLCSHHRSIMKFSRVINNDQSDVHAQDQGQRLKVKVIGVKTQLNRFQTVTPVWIHIYEMMQKASCCLGELPYCSSRSFVKFQGHTAKESSILNQKGGYGLQFQFEFTNGKKWCTKLEIA